ncbi:MAG: cytochrome c oxidase cbb3-type subunit 3, partial [Phenylobacterium sp.]
GQRLFATNCSVCHGSTATGAVGFPNLTDDVWLWGSKGADIEATIKHGRTAYMPAFKSIFNHSQISDIGVYLQSMDGNKGGEGGGEDGGEGNSGAIARGRGHFAQVCFACHGDQAKGKPLMGAPDLTNSHWLYGNSTAVLEQSMKNGRQGIMPAFNDRLGEDKVHILAGYVYGLTKPR